MNRRIILLLSAFLVLAMGPSLAHGQTGEDALRFTDRAPATGARLMGMAGVGIAGIGDYSALYTNPAGLGYLQSSLFGGALNSIAATDESLYQTSEFSTAGEGDVRTTRLGNLAYFHKVPTTQGALVVGASYNQLNSFDRNLLYSGPNSGNSISDSFLPYADEFEVVEDEDGNLAPQFLHDVPDLAYYGGAIEFLSENVGTGRPLFYQAVVPGTTIDQAGNVSEEGRTNELSFGGAWEAAPTVLVGLSANFAFGTYRFNSMYEEIDSRDENTLDDYIVILPDRDLMGFDALEYEEGFESDLTGFNLRAGVSTELSQGLRLGFQLETPTFYQISEDYFRSLTTFFDEGGSLSDSQDGQFEYELRTPWRLGGGAAFRSGDLMIGGDVEYVDWSQMEFDDDDNTFDDENRNIRDNLEPVFNSRVGAEYRLGDVALRGGFAWQPDPRSYEIENAGETTDRSKTFFSAGLGYRFADRFVMDFGWMQERFDDQYVPYRDVEEPPVVEEDVVRNRFSIGVTVLF